jgi:biotin carboxyl carrier protein
MKKNAYLGRIDIEKNELRLEEAQAKQKQLKATFDLKRSAEQAELRILEIQRDRAYRAMKSAEDNAERMVVKSPIPGVVVMRMVWRGNGQVEIQEGEEARPGHADHAGRGSGTDAGACQGESGRRPRSSSRPAGTGVARCLSRSSFHGPRRASDPGRHDEHADQPRAQLRRHRQHSRQSSEAHARSSRQPSTSSSNAKRMSSLCLAMRS